VVDDLAAPDARQHLGLLGQPLGGDDQGDVAPDRLRGRPAEHPLGGAVPAGDDAVQRLADDGVVGPLHDGGEPRLQLLGALVAGARARIVRVRL
jgi:hypothetical protein